MPPGTGFFDAHPLFLESSTVAADRQRLNLRHEAIIAQNRDALEGARVLDIASHDGRWSLAALEAGAIHVIGAEGRPELVAASERNLAAYGVSPDRYRFVQGDLFETLGREPGKVDTVLCLGFLYHTLRYEEFFAVVDRFDPRFLILDTQVALRPEPVIELRTNGVEKDGSAFSEAPPPSGRVLVGRPSIAALRKMARVYGFRFDGLADWAGLLEDNPGVRQIDAYRDGLRTTLRFHRDRSPG